MSACRTMRASLKTVVIGFSSNRKSEMFSGRTDCQWLLSEVFNFSRNSISSRPSTFSPASKPSSVDFAPQKSAARFRSTMSRLPVRKSSVLNVLKFCDNLTRKHQRITFTRTAFQSSRVAGRYGLLRIFAAIGLRSSIINRCTFGWCGNRHAWYNASDVRISIPLTHSGKRGAILDSPPNSSSVLQNTALAAGSYFRTRLLRVCARFLVSTVTTVWPSASQLVTLGNRGYHGLFAQRASGVLFGQLR